MSAPIGLTEAARSRLPRRIERRELAAQLVVGLPFLLAAGALLAFGRDEPVSALHVIAFVGAAALMGRLAFETGAGYTVPTQLVFVPMLFVLPPAIVPLVVAAALVLDRLPDVVAGRRHAGRLLLVLGDAWFALGPAAVFVVFDIRSPDLADWPIYALALLAQLAGDLGAAATTEWIAHRLGPRRLLGVLREIWLVDALLSPIGLLAAFAAEQHDGAYLLVLPLGVLLAHFARERRERIGQAIQLSAAYRGTALLLGDVIETDDEYTGRHSKGVVVFATAIADAMGVEDDQRRLVEFGAMLHDIGKITTPKEIVNKPGPLSDEEWEIIRDHTVVGQRMLDRVGGTLHDVGLVVRSSHERFDGSGYPDGLTREEIPLAARIVAVADAYSAMTTRRSYRDAMSHEYAIAELRRNAGSQFDPRVVESALDVITPGADRQASRGDRLVLDA